MILSKRLPLFLTVPTAVILYAVFAGCLFFPHKQSLTHYKLLFPVESVIASAGVFILCRRWVLSFFASLAGGAIYGFGTYACSLLCFHPFAGLVYALIPWTFVPAVFFYRFSKLAPAHTTIISGLLVFLSILFIFAAYQFSSSKYLFPIPAQTRLLPASLLGIIDSIGVKQDIFAPGFYHVCIAGLVMGTALLIKAKKIGILLLFAGTLAASFYKPVLDVPPVVWTSIPVLICSIIVALGLEAIVLAGAGDGKWLLGAIACLLIFSIANIFITCRQNIIPLSSALYGIGIAAVLAVYFVAESHFSWHLLRMFVLYAAVFIDIFVSTRHNIDSIF